MNAPHLLGFDTPIESRPDHDERTLVSSDGIRLEREMSASIMRNTGADYALLYKNGADQVQLFTHDDRLTEPRKKVDPDSFARVADRFNHGRYDGIALIKGGGILELWPRGRRADSAVPSAVDPTAADSEVPYSVQSAARFTRLRYNEPIGKHYFIDGAGQLQRQILAAGTSATAHIVESRSIEELANEFRYATSADIFVAGVPHSDRLRVTTKQSKRGADEIARSKDDLPFPNAPGVMFLDNDCPADSSDDQFHVYVQSVPALASASYVYAPSSSAWVYEASSGTELKGVGGQHYAIPVVDARDIPRALKALHGRLVLAGFGTPSVTKSGAILIKSPVDLAMRTPNQPLFQRVVLNEGLVQRKKEHIGSHRGDVFLFDSRLISDLTADEQVRLAEITAELQKRIEVEAQQIRQQWIEARVDAVASVNNISRPAAAGCLQAALTNGASSARFDLVPGLQIKFSSGWVDVGELLATPGKYDGQSCADPLEPDYGSGVGVAKFFANPNGTPVIHSHAHGGQTFFLQPDFRDIDLSNLLFQQSYKDPNLEPIIELKSGLENGFSDDLKAKSVDDIYPNIQWKSVSENSSENFPEHLLTPPGILLETMQWIIACAQKPQPVLALVASLSIIATVLARKVKTQTGLRTNLYLISVAGTSAGKDHGRKCVKNAFFHAGLDEMVGGEELASGKAVLSAAARQPATVFQIDEIGLMLKSIRSKNAGSYQQEIIAILMKLFSSAGSVYKGTEYTDQKIRPRQDILYPCINVHGTTTAEPLFESFGSSDLNTGYINRLLIIFSPRYHGEMVLREITDPPERLIDWMKEARKISQNKGDLIELNSEDAISIPMTEGAKELFTDLEKFQEQQIESKEAEGMHHLWGRCWEHAAKIALVAACAKHGDPEVFSVMMSNGKVEIDEASAKWAIDFVKHVLGRMEREIAARVADSEFGQFAKAALVAIREAGPRGVTERELGRAYHKFKGLPPNQRDAVIQMLCRNEEIFSHTYPPASGKGRPRQVLIASEFDSVVRKLK